MTVLSVSQALAQRTTLLDRGVSVRGRLMATLAAIWLSDPDNPADRLTLGDGELVDRLLVAGLGGYMGGHVFDDPAVVTGTLTGTADGTVLVPQVVTADREDGPVEIDLTAAPPDADA